MRHIPFLTTMVSMVIASAFADVPVIPRPVKETTLSGTPLEYFKLAKEDKGVALHATTPIKAAESLANEKAILESILKKNCPNTPINGMLAPIALNVDDKMAPDAYKLEVGTSGANPITITGGSPTGVFYGIQSLNQIIIVNKSKGIIKIPHLILEDAPATQWRGVMLDTARHFHSKEFIKKFIDLMALHKLNRLHWHMVDSEGWRLEIKKYPKLVEVTQPYPASYPSEDPIDRSRPAQYMYGHFHGGGYYTQEDVKEIVKYAKDRHIEIMPEIEFPGHSMAALTAYPEFGTTGKVPSVKSNISVDLYGPNEKALGFLKDVLDETMELFPFEFIHFGGDEAPKHQWKESAEAQAKIKELGLKNEDELQAWMFNELAKHIAKKGRRPVGWEEIMHGDNMDTLTKSAVIMPWLSNANGIKSANAGYGVLHSQFGSFYLDSYQTNSPAENWTLYRGPLTLERIYTYGLFPKELSEEGRKNIFGAQCQLWNELMPKSEHIEYQAFPRLAALAELTWTQGERKDYQDFYKRLVDHAKVLDSYKVNYRYIDPLPSAKWSPEELANETITIPVTPDQIADSKGEMIVQFSYDKGQSRLEIKKIALLENGKLVAEDTHDGFAGSQNQDNYYRLKFTPKKRANYSLNITHGNKGASTNSYGSISIFTGKGLELFNPRNFAGGDYPSAEWSTGDTKAPIGEIRIPIDGLVKTPGSYELIFTGKQINTPVIIGSIHIVGTGKPENKSKGIATIDPTSKSSILPLTLTPQDIKAGNSIVLKIKSTKPSSGEIRVRKAPELPGTNNTYEWTPELLAEGQVNAYAKSVTPKKNGSLQISFLYQGGGSGLDIKSVDIVENGKIIASKKESGFAGQNPKNNIYTIDSPSLKAGAKYTLRIAMAGAGGTDSRGKISVQ